MLRTKDKQESKVNNSRSYTDSYDYQARENSHYRERINNASDQYSYPQSRRATEDDRYQSRYSNPRDMYSNNYNVSYRTDTYSNTNSESYYSNNTNMFVPIEIQDVYMENSRTAKKVRSSVKGKMSTRGKIFAAVCSALMTLIIVMLLVNTIPSVNAQTPMIVTPNSTVVETVAGSTTDVSSGEGITMAPGYKFDTTTNWFDNVCDFLGGLFS